MNIRLIEAAASILGGRFPDDSFTPAKSNYVLTGKGLLRSQLSATDYCRRLNNLMHNGISPTETAMKMTTRR